MSVESEWRMRSPHIANGVSHDACDDPPAIQRDPKSKTGSDRRREVLKRIEECVCKDRQNSYGDAEDNFQNIADFWTVHLRTRGLLKEGAVVTSLDAAAMQDLVKDARRAANIEYPDNWVDGGGYNTCGGGILLQKGGKL